MAVKTRTTKAANISATAREIDFVSSFGRDWEALLGLLGLTNMVEKAPGTEIKIKTATVTLQTAPAEGDEVPYSQAAISEAPLGTITLERYMKGVTAEAIAAYGYDTAIAKTDDQFRIELTNAVCAKFYTLLATGSTTATVSTFQLALATAKGNVVNKFQDLGLATSGVVGFCNTLDFYDYLGTAAISVQNKFGFSYVKDFMGYDTLFLLPAKYIARNKVIATPVDNLICYYINAANSDFDRAGLQFTTDGVTNLIGYHTEGNYVTGVSESSAILGVTIAAEYLAGIAVITVSP